MAEQPIRHEQIIEEDVFVPASEGADKLKLKLDALVAVFKELLIITGKNFPVADPKTVQQYGEQLKLLQKIDAAERGLTITQKLQVQVQEKQNKAKREYRAELKAEESAYARLNNLYATLAKRAKDLGASQGSSSKAFKEAAKEAKALNTELKAIDHALGQDNRSVGNYADGIRNASNQLGGFSKVIVTALGYLEKQADALKATNALLKLQQLEAKEAGAAQEAAQLSTIRWNRALGLLKFSIKGLGVGLLVGLLGSLTAFFKGTEDGAVKLEAIMNTLGDVFRIFLNRLGEFGRGLIDFFPALLKDLSNGFFNLTQEFKSFLGLDAEAKRSTDNTSEALNKMKNAFDGIGDAISKTYDLEKKLAQLRLDNRYANLKDIAVIRELGSEIEKLNQIASDQTLPFDERNKAAEESLKLQEKLAAAEIRLAQRDVSVAKQAVEIRKLQGKGLIDAEEELSKALDKLDDARSKADLLKLRTEEIARQTRIKDLTNQIQLIQETADKENDIRNKQIADTRRSFDERRKLIADFDNDSKERYENEIKLLQQTDDEIKRLSGQTSVLIDANDLLNTSNAEQLELKIKALNLSDKEEDLLRRIIALRKADANAINADTEALNKLIEADKKYQEQLTAQLVDEQFQGRLDKLNFELQQEQQSLLANYNKQKELIEKTKALRKEDLTNKATFKIHQVEDDDTKSEETKAAEILLINEKLKNDLAKLEYDDYNLKKALRKKEVEDALKNAELIKNAYFEARQQEIEQEKEINNQKISELDRQIDQQFELLKDGQANTYDFLQRERAKALEEKAALEKKAQKEKEKEQLVEIYFEFVKQFADEPNSVLKALEKTAEAYGGKAVAEAIAGSFAGGVEDFKGKGTGTSDSNIIRFSKGESVLTEKGTRETKGLATAINKKGKDGVMQWVYNYITNQGVSKEVAKEKAQTFTEFYSSEPVYNYITNNYSKDERSFITKSVDNVKNLFNKTFHAVNTTDARKFSYDNSVSNEDRRKVENISTDNSVENVSTDNRSFDSNDVSNVSDLTNNVKTNIDKSFTDKSNEVRNDNRTNKDYVFNTTKEMQSVINDARTYLTNDNRQQNNNRRNIEHSYVSTDTANQYLNHYYSYPESDNKAAEKAVVQTLQDNNVKIPSYFIGKEDIGTVSQPLDANGGRVTILHNNESVLKGDVTKETKGLVTEANEDGRKGVFNWMFKQPEAKLLVPQIKMPIPQVMITEKSPKQETSEAMLSMLTHEMQDLKKVIKNKKELTVSRNVLGELIIDEKASGIHTQTIQKKPTITQTRKPLG